MLDCERLWKLLKLDEIYCALWYDHEPMGTASRMWWFGNTYAFDPQLVELV